ncbi:hypothetical protein RJ640_029367 [Escallonia rubra]|uniref:Uncharacterized protein n=1 Tax=Escallonia rubra TaxID=112253 RepID=A0AA88UL24_9ASTE|nr:hypothetical protein RJ640_029367 [Escallonia rubra]
MVAHEIGVFGEIDSFKGKPAQPLTAVDGLVLGGGGATAARLRAPLSVHLSILPVFDYSVIQSGEPQRTKVKLDIYKQMKNIFSGIYKQMNEHKSSYEEDDEEDMYNGYSNEEHESNEPVKKVIDVFHYPTSISRISKKGN